MKASKFHTPRAVRNGCRGVLVCELGKDVGTNTRHVNQANAGGFPAHAEEHARDLAVSEEVIGRSTLEAELPSHVGHATKFLIGLGEVARLDRGGGRLIRTFHNRVTLGSRGHNARQHDHARPRKSAMCRPILREVDATDGGKVENHKE